MFSYDPYAQLSFPQFLQFQFGFQRPPYPQAPAPNLTGLQALLEFQQRSLAWFTSAGHPANAFAAFAAITGLLPRSSFAASAPPSGLAAVTDAQDDAVRSALAQATVFWREASNAMNGTGVLFAEATEQMQGLFNRGPYKSLE